MDTSQRDRGIVLGLVVLLLTLGVIAPLEMFRGPVGTARAVETQSDPQSCEAVGNNWTSCDNAFASDDVYAVADSSPGAGTQVGRPTGTIAADNWTAVNASTNHEATDEVVPNNTTDFASGNVTGATLELSLGPLKDPHTDASHILEFTAIAYGTTAQERMDVDLYQDTTLIASAFSNDVITRVAYANYSYTLSAGEAASITNYSALRVRFVISQGVAPGEFINITQAQFAIPSAEPPDSDSAWSGFGFNLTLNDTVNKVEVGVEWFRVIPDPVLNVSVSWDGGANWSANKTATNKSADDDTVEWLNFTDAQSWAPPMLTETNFRVRLGTFLGDARLDYVTARVNYDAAPTIADLRLQDAAGFPMAGELLEINTTYRFVFTVEDQDGWGDIGDSDGSISLRMWYDGNASPELIFAEQTNGSDHRIELRYQDLSDPSTATLAEWSVAEGSAFYNASGSSLSAIMSGPTIVGYYFNLSVRLGYHLRAAADPLDETPGDYNDADSWNVEVLADDGKHVAVLQTTPSGEHLEFGVESVALLDYTVDADPTVIQPAEQSILRINVTNSGWAAAAIVWVNVTLPEELDYVSDDAFGKGWVLVDAYNYSTSNLPRGTHLFNITTRADGGVSNGTMASATLDFKAVDGAGATLNESTLTAQVTITNADLAVHLVADKATATPGDLVDLTASIVNAGTVPAQDVRILAPLDPNVNYVPGTCTENCEAGAGSLWWNFSAVDALSALTLDWTVQIHDDTADGTHVVSEVQGQYVDPNGTTLFLGDATETVVMAPAFDPVLRLDRPTAERGDLVEATLYLNNTGSGTASFGWANWTLEPHYDLVGVPQTGGSSWIGTSFTFSNLASGSHILRVQLEVLSGMNDGLDMNLVVAWEAKDGNGNYLGEAQLPASVELLAPRVALHLELDLVDIPVGSTLVADLNISNEGRAAAEGWLNVSLPDGVRYLAIDKTFVRAEEEGRVGWYVPEVSPQSSLRLRIDFEVTGGTGPRALRFIMYVTDGAGSDPVSSMSEEVSFRILPTFWRLLIWILPIVAAAGVAAYLVVRRLRGPTIEEVFVVHNSGILISHQSRTLTPDQDEDILAAMLKTVQDFVQDAFAGRENVPMKALEFERFNILIERGAHHYVAVVYQGKEDSVLKSRLSRLSKRIEEEYGDRLAAWTGDVRELRPIRKILPMLWGRRGLPGEEPMEEEGAFERLRHRIRGILSPVQRRVRGEEVPTEETLEDSPGATPEEGLDDLADVGPEPAREEGQDGAPQGEAEEPGEEDEEE